MSNTPTESEPVTEHQPSVPPIAFNRNEHGLYDHVEYVFTSDGFVDWRKMVTAEFLVPNKDKTEETEETEETDVTKLPDNKLLILLGGLKKLARLRGYSSVNHEVVHASEHLVTVKTTITWIPNYETDNRVIQFSALADAHGRNTDKFTRYYLAAIAENRGLVRVIRNFLGINIAGQDELGAAKVKEVADEATASGQGLDVLTTMLSVNDISFSAFQNRMIKEEVEGAAEWENLTSIPEVQIFDIIAIVEKLIKSRPKAKKSE